MARNKSDEQLEREAEQARHREDERPSTPDPDAPAGSAGGGVHATGAGGGGYAVGGLAGSPEGGGEPNLDELEEASGSGNFDQELEAEDTPPYSGHAGGAVGGAPSGKRASGGRTHGGTEPGTTYRGDSTVGSNPPREKNKR